MSAGGTARPVGDALAEATSRHVVLVGLPGAGKSTVGPRLAALLGRPFHDIDGEIVRREGRSVSELFAAGGEARFRAVEAEVTLDLLAGPPSVIAAGGGWVLTDANLAAATTAALVVHLGVTPATAAARLGGGADSRPLLASGDLRGRLEELELHRRERYGRADVVVDTEALDTDGVANAIRNLIDRSADV